MAVMSSLPLSVSIPLSPAQAAPGPDNSNNSASSKRALSRQYKESPPAMGIYAIRNLATGQVFLGAGLNLDGAMNRDRFELTQKAHRNKALLKDWLALGPDGFAFEVVDTLKRRDDPGIDYQPELAALLAMWTEDFQQRGAIGYPARR
jgi:hypothetical protein